VEMPIESQTDPGFDGDDSAGADAAFCKMGTLQFCCRGVRSPLRHWRRRADRIWGSTGSFAPEAVIRLSNVMEQRSFLCRAYIS